MYSDRRPPRAGRGQPGEAARRSRDSGHASSDAAWTGCPGRGGAARAGSKSRSSDLSWRPWGRSIRALAQPISRWTPYGGRRCASGRASTIGAWPDIVTIRPSAFEKSQKYAEAAQADQGWGVARACRHAWSRRRRRPVEHVSAGRTLEPFECRQESRRGRAEVRPKSGRCSVIRRDARPASPRACTVAPRPRNWTTATN